MPCRALLLGHAATPMARVTAGMLKTFALYRYKGNLRITPK